MADDERLRGELYARRAFGEPQATGLLSRAIEACGREIGKVFACYGPKDLTGRGH